MPAARCSRGAHAHQRRQTGTHPPGTGGPRAATSSLDIGIAISGAQDVAVTVRGPIGRGGAATVAELVRALATTGAVHVIVDVEGSMRLCGDATRMLGPVGATIRSRGGWLMIAGDDEAMTPTPLRESDLQDAFSAYRDATTAGSPGVGQIWRAAGPTGPFGPVDRARRFDAWPPARGYGRRASR